MSLRLNRKYKLSSDMSQELARMRYFERIGKCPWFPRKPMPKYKHLGTLYKRDKVRDCMGNRINNKPPF